MTKRRIKVIWGASDELSGEWRLGLWGTYERDPGSRVKGLAVSVRGLLRWTIGVAVVGYVAGAVALFAWFSRNPYNLVGLSDTLLLPVRWSHVRELRGRMLIEEGLDDLKARRWIEANMKLRVGLERAPQDLRARLALAQFYLQAGGRPEAVKILQAGLSGGYPGKRYLEVLFGIAMEGEAYDVVTQTAERFAQTSGADAAWLFSQRVQSLMRSGRADEALRLIEERGGAVGPELKEARVLALLELKRAPEAVAFLEQWRQQAGGDAAVIARLSVRAYREAGRFEAMDRAWLEFRQQAPADARTYAYGVVQRFLAGQREAAGRALDEYFLRFASTPENLIMLATALAEARAPDLVQRCLAEGQRHGFPVDLLRYALIQAQLGTGDWAGAKATLNAHTPAKERRGPVEKFAVDWLTALVGVLTRADAAPQDSLLAFLQQRPLPMRVYRQTCEPLVKARRFDVAQKVLDLAAHSYPDSRTLAGLRAEVEAGLRPATPAVASSVGTPTGGMRENAFFEALEAAQRERSWAEAAEAIQKVRVAKPAWLAAREADVLEWQMRISVQLEDVPELLSAASLYLDGSAVRAARALEIVRELDARGRREDGSRLLREILRKSPDFPPAVRLLKLWREAKPAAADSK